VLGALLSKEYAVEAAAITNPSMVPFGEEPDGTRFVMSLRAIGEGHISSIRFREGIISSSGDVSLLPEQPFSWRGAISPRGLDRDGFLRSLVKLGVRDESASLLLDRCDGVVTGDVVARAIADLRKEENTEMDSLERAAEWLTATNYRVVFDDVPLDGRILAPASPSESHGLEDARFVRLDEGSGSHRFVATYTAYDGRVIRPQIVTTEDFRSFEMRSLSGRFAQNKGMAVFPRKINGMFAALTRHDGHRIHLAWSHDLDHWDSAEFVAGPDDWGDRVQIGNCGSPIETTEGWLVLTHGVGLMRRYTMSAWLLDLDEPTRVIGRLGRPLLEPAESERDGYVPNVVYSCGGMLVNGVLYIPFGIGDRTAGMAATDLDPLIEELQANSVVA
jgi:predicted GH43/DUF377 family glycosyl hydrolase